MAGAPPELIARVATETGAWSAHAADDADRLDLEWEDVVEVASTAEDWKREKDETGEAIDGWKDTLKGRDRSGRRMYLTGKLVYYRGVRSWYVIAFHENTDR